MYYLPKPRKRRSRDLSPGILHHILYVIGIDRIRNMSEKIVIIAVHRLTVNGNAVTVLENGIPHTRIGKNIYKSAIRFRRCCRVDSLAYLI